MRTKLEKIINGKKYNTETAEIIASNEYWDGSNWERGGRNLHLYKSPKGQFFIVGSSMWQGESTSLELITIEEAKRAYEGFTEHEVEYEIAFGVVAEEG